VFISYKTREHGGIVRDMAKVLSENNFDVWLDVTRDVPQIRISGLDLTFIWALGRADVLVSLVPSVAGAQRPRRTISWIGSRSPHWQA
jgi:hypothetical protein